MRREGAAVLDRDIRRARVGKLMARQWQLYALLLLPIAYLIIFHYIPLSGIVLAFKKYYVKEGIWGSPWIGFRYFEQFFRSPLFFVLLRNTVVLSLYAFLAGFPFPIALALMLNEIRALRFKKFVQTITFAPYFISVVVMMGMVIQLFAYHGLINGFLKYLDIEPVNYLAVPSMFRHLYVWSGIWQATGYSAIIYIAALAAVDPNLYEAALIDGATRFQKIRHIDIPSIMPVIIILLILNSGTILSVGFEKAFLLQNPVNNSVSEVISTYVYKVGLVDAQYAFGTAVNLFNSVITILMIVMVNVIARRVSETSLW